MSNHGLPNAKRLRLRDAPARAMGPAVELLSRWVDPKHLRLGGGTALDARWHHRDSTDLDFFCASEHANGLFYARMDELKNDLRRFAAAGRISREGLLVTQRTIVHFLVGNTPVSFGRVLGFHGDPRDEVEDSTGVVLSGTRDILAKKMFNRLGDGGQLVDRDAYDFAVAGTLAPNDLAYAWNLLHDEAKQHVLELCRSAKSVPPTSSLRNAAYPVLAADIWTRVLKMFETDLRRVPSLSMAPPLEGRTHEGIGR